MDDVTEYCSRHAQIESTVLADGKSWNQLYVRACPSNLMTLSNWLEQKPKNLTDSEKQFCYTYAENLWKKPAHHSVVPAL